MNKSTLLLKLRNIIEDEIVITPLGYTSREWYGLSDRPRNFYMLGSMGMPIPFGLGVALSTKHIVITLEGDGSCLMNLGALTTVGNLRPDNLKIIIVDNNCYESTGNQPTATAANTDLCRVAEGCGIESHSVACDESLDTSLSWLWSTGTKLLVAKVAPKASEGAYPRLDLMPADISERFRRSIHR